MGPKWRNRTRLGIQEVCSRCSTSAPLSWSLNYQWSSWVENPTHLNVRSYRPLSTYRIDVHTLQYMTQPHNIRRIVEVGCILWKLNTLKTDIWCCLLLVSMSNVVKQSKPTTVFDFSKSSALMPWFVTCLCSASTSQSSSSSPSLLTSLNKTLWSFINLSIQRYISSLWFAISSWSLCLLSSSLASSLMSSLGWETEEQQADRLSPKYISLQSCPSSQPSHCGHRYILKDVHKDWIIELHNELLETMKKSMRFI